MKEYFQLQFKMANRKLTAFGLHPIAGYSLMFIGFVGLSFYLFYKSELAEYIYILTALSVVYQLSEIKRNDFLKSCFGDRNYLKIRLIENGIVIIPFSTFLVYNLLFISTLLTVIIALLLALIKFDNKLNLTIPSPFYKKPFEFIVGFRKSFYLFGLAYFLTVMAVSVGNFNLGIFSLILTFLISLSFYVNPENEYFVWSFSMSPRQFLTKKIKTAIFHSTLLSIPVFVSLGIFFFGNIGILLTFQCLGYLALITIILAKYSAFPKKINLPQVILAVLAIQFPPFLLAVIPILYLQSVNSLNEFLE